MSDADYEFITEEEMSKIFHVSGAMHEMVNKLLNDKCQQDYFDKVEGKLPDIKNGLAIKHTHEIFYFTKEIKPDVVECDHEWPDKVTVTISAGSPEEYSRIANEIKFCTKCGERLNNE